MITTKQKKGCVIIGLIILFSIFLYFTEENGLPFLPHETNINIPTNMKIEYFPNYTVSFQREIINTEYVDNISYLRQEIRNRNVIIAMGNGNSMYPTFKEGDLMAIQTKFSINDIKENSIVSYTRDGQNFVHRIIWKDDKHFIAKGDGNLLADPGKQEIMNITGIVVKRYIPVESTLP